MKTISKISIGMTVALFALFGIGAVVFALAPGSVDLATTANFAVLSGSGVADTTPSDITGDVGASPVTGAAILITDGEVDGTIYSTNGAGPAGSVTNPGLLSAAKVDMNDAYIDAMGRANSGVNSGVVTGDLGAFNGGTLTPGVYEDNNAPDSLSLTGTLTLDGQGNPNAVFIFKSGSTLITAASSNVVLINGAQACNVFWAVGSSATLGTNSTFAGTILAAASITDAGGSTISGRLLADADNDGTGAITLNNTTVAVSTCAPSLTLNKTVDNSGGGTALDTAWTLTATGALGSPTNLSGTDPVQSDVSFSNATFKADTYTLTESGGPADYTASAWSCIVNGGAPVSGASVALARGDIAVCAVTNTYSPTAATTPESSGGSSRNSGGRNRATSATLHVVKHVVNDSGGTEVASSFSVHVTLSGNDVDGSPKDGVEAPGRSYTLRAGVYAVTEDAGDASYMQSFSGDCDSNGRVTLSAGDDKICTIENDDIAPAFVAPLPGFPNTGLAEGDGITRAEAVASFQRSLAIGATGTDVRALQIALMQKGFLVIAPGAYGYFGPLTREAVLKYQTRGGLPPLGIFGPITRTKLISELEE